MAIILEMQLTKIFPILTESDCVITQQILRNQTPKTSPSPTERGWGIPELFYVDAFKYT